MTMLPNKLSGGASLPYTHTHTPLTVWLWLVVVVQTKGSSQETTFHSRKEERTRERERDLCVGDHGEIAVVNDYATNDYDDDDDDRTLQLAVEQQQQQPTMISLTPLSVCVNGSHNKYCSQVEAKTRSCERERERGR